jgi:hypothetical protein
VVKPRLRLIPNGMTVPDKFKFVCPIDGHHIAQHMDRETWMKAIRRHYADNGYEIPPDIEEIAEDQLCQSLDGEWCQYCDGSERGAHIDRRIGVQTIISGTKVLSNFLLDAGLNLVGLAESPIVSQEEANRRALICSRCYALDTVQGCGSCLSVAEAVAEVVGTKTTASDNVLEGKACLVCKCAAKANVWMDVRISKSGVTDEARKMFDTIPHCWKAEALREIDQTQVSDINGSHD